jgi:hypothetical protein
VVGDLEKTELRGEEVLRDGAVMRREELAEADERLVLRTDERALVAADLLTIGVFTADPREELFREAVLDAA